MRRPFLTCLSVLIAVAAVGCGDSLTEPVDRPSQPPAISADVGPPSMSGVVERFFFGGIPPAIYDADTNLTAVFGMDVAAFCLAGGPGNANPFEYADQEALLSLVHAPGQGGLITIRGEGSIYIWDGFVEFADSCTQPLGAGWGKTVYTENVADAPGPNAADTFQFSARGPVTTATGTQRALLKVKGLVKDGALKALEFTVRMTG